MKNNVTGDLAEMDAARLFIKEGWLVFKCLTKDMGIDLIVYQWAARRDLRVQVKSGPITRKFGYQVVNVDSHGRAYREDEIDLMVIVENRHPHRIFIIDWNGFCVSWNRTHNQYPLAIPWTDIMQFEQSKWPGWKQAAEDNEARKEEEKKSGFNQLEFPFLTKFEVKGEHLVPQRESVQAAL